MKFHSGVTISVVSHGQAYLVSLLLSKIVKLNEIKICRVIVTHNLPDSDLPFPEGAAFEFVQLHNVKPFGFAKNHNIAFRHCQTEWFAVVNPDIEFNFGNPFPGLIEAIDSREDIGVVAPVLVDPKNGKSEILRDLPTLRELICSRLGVSKIPPEPVWLAGAFLFFRSEAFFALAGFDEKYHLYCEDVDISLRMQLERWRISLIKEVKIMHSKQHGSHKRLRYFWWHVSSLIRLWNSGLFKRYRSF